jgi:hypothetical protein
MLGMGIAVYGAAVGHAFAGESVLLTTLGLLHASAGAGHKEQVKAERKPAYVLLKAKELLEHAH